MDPEASEKNSKRVLIVGAGAAGTACAWALVNHAPATTSFAVTLWEKATRAGGVATTESMCTSHAKEQASQSTDAMKRDVETPFDFDLLNDGVQGGASSYHNSINILRLHGLDVTPVKMKVSFGKGPNAWNNYDETDIIRRLRPEIKRFGETLKTIRKHETTLGPIPIGKLLRMFRYSNDFCDFIVFPLVALFFGTGNQTPYVASALFARVFTDEDLRLYDYDPERFLSQQADMFAFPNLGEWYERMLDGLRAKGAIVCLGRAVQTIVREKDTVKVTDEQGITEEFDELVLACDAETSLRILGAGATWKEKKVLGNVTYYDDITVTHTDEEYMERYYELNKDRGKDAPMYYVHVDEKEPQKIEMSFNLTKYQPLLASSETNVYQTIFLDKRNETQWTIGEINPQKVLLRKWWHQFSHHWKHFVFTVPWTKYLQGKQHTWYCGSWLLVNTHEIAMISGLAVAYRLGATYPFDNDELARKQFEQFLDLCHHGRPKTRK